MSGFAAVAPPLLVLSLMLVSAFVLRPPQLDEPSGKTLAFVVLFLLPITATALGVAAHLDRATSTDFCLSCHEMKPYGESLYVDDQGFVAANHFQNRRVPREAACYACHTDYTMFGDVKAKITGLRHLWVHYVGTVPAELASYRPYRNGECLHCHADARRFEEEMLHADIRDELTAGETSCLDCHEPVHDVQAIGDLPRWTSAAAP